MPDLAYRVFLIAGVKWLLLISREWLQRARERFRREQPTLFAGQQLISEGTGQEVPI